jgi:hypothetical protein
MSAKKGKIFSTVELLLPEGYSLLMEKFCAYEDSSG